MEAQTRHRVIGLVLLLVLAALVTPIIFRTPEQVRVALDMDVPPPPQVEPLSLDPVVTADETADARAQISDAREDVRVESEKRDQQAQDAAASGKPVSSDPADREIPTGWTLQVAALSSKEGAEALVSKLHDAHYTAYMRASDEDGKRLYRVFVGPELERDQIEHSKAELARDLRFKLDGLIVPYTL